MSTLVQPTCVPAVDQDRYREPAAWMNRLKPPPFPLTLGHKPASVYLGHFYGIIFYRIVDDHKFSLASFHLDGDALEWYRWLYCNKKLIN